MPPMTQSEILEAIRKDVSQIKSDVAVLAAQHIDVRGAVFGRERPGLTDRVRGLEEREQACPARRWAQPSIIVSLAAVFVAVVSLYLSRS